MTEFKQIVNRALALADAHGGAFESKADSANGKLKIDHMGEYLHVCYDRVPDEPSASCNLRVYLHHKTFRLEEFIDPSDLLLSYINSAFEEMQKEKIKDIKR